MMPATYFKKSETVMFTTRLHHLFCKHLEAEDIEASVSSTVLSLIFKQAEI